MEQTQIKSHIILNGLLPVQVPVGKLGVDNGCLPVIVARIGREDSSPSVVPDVLVARDADACSQFGVIKNIPGEEHRQCSQIAAFVVVIGPAEKREHCIVRDILPYG